MALVARDGGCVIPGHDCPPEHCQAHHLIRWIDGGRTDLTNLALTCTHGHWLVHEGGGRLYRDADDYWMLQLPDGRTIRGLRLGDTALGRANRIANSADKPRGP
jgi:HNH endonuclease